MTFQDLITDIQQFIHDLDQDCQDFTAWVDQHGYAHDAEVRYEDIQKIPSRFMPLLVGPIEELIVKEKHQSELDDVPGTTRKNNHEF